MQSKVCVLAVSGFGLLGLMSVFPFLKEVYLDNGKENGKYYSNRDIWGFILGS